MESIFEKYKRKDLDEFLKTVAKYKAFDYEAVFENSIRAVNSSTTKGVARPRDADIVEARWYDSLARGTPDYSVYDDPFYISELWSCWVVYSRKSLLALKSPKSTNFGSVIERIGTIFSVADLGCGMGYTTAGLVELFPGARVFGTNLPNTFQFKAAREEGARRGFEMYSDTAFVGKVDLIFASEYFEHIQDPLFHLDKVVAECSPRVLVLANSFGPRAIGHFSTFYSGGKAIPNKQMGRVFGKRLKDHGYKKLETNIWNNKPSVWVRG